MMFRTLLLASSSLLFASTAMARADVVVDIDSSQGDFVYDAVGYDVTVSNIGNRNASDVELVIELPQTNTSPTVHIMGNLVAFDSACVQVGNTLECDLGRIRKGRSATVWFDLELPQSSAPLEVYADVSTRSRENSTTNNDDLHTASLEYYDIPLAGGEHVVNTHCTGQGLTAFFECSLYPSSLSSHGITLNADFSITFDFAPAGYTGVWSQPTDDSLEFTYLYNGQPHVEFVGQGVPGDCFEGLTTFPASPGWVSPYSVCL